jgi:capsid protein
MSRPTFFQQVKFLMSDIRAMHRGLPAHQYQVENIESFLGDLRKLYKFAHHEAADTSRISADWSTHYDTPYWNVRANWRTIVARSISQVDNDPHAKGIMNTLLNNVIRGGMKPMPRVKMYNGQPVTGLNTLLSRLWERYHDEWDATGKRSFSEAQRMIFAEIVKSGTVLTNKVAAPAGHLLPVTTQVINCLRLDDGYDIGAPTVWSNPAVKQTLFGISFDENGRPVEYRIKGVDRAISWRYMKHHYQSDQAEEYLGLPWFTSALRYLWAIQHLIEDKLISSRLQAMIGLFVPNSIAAGLIKKQLNSNSQITMEPGKIYYGDKGDKPEIVQADDSIQAVLQPLQKLILHTIGMTFGVSYMTFTRDVDAISFASGKINKNEDQKAFRGMQGWFAREVCDTEWHEFVYRCFAANLIPGYSLTDYLADPRYYDRVQWSSPGFDFIDPAREVQAISQLYGNKMMTLHEFYSEQGQNWKDQIDQLEDEAGYILSKKNIIEMQQRGLTTNANGQVPGPKPTAGDQPQPSGNNSGNSDGSGDGSVE